jgi:hypothetical protein
MDVLFRSLLTTTSELYVLDAVKWKDDELREWHLPFLSQNSLLGIEENHIIIMVANHFAEIFHVWSRSA